MFTKQRTVQSFRQFAFIASGFMFFLVGVVAISAHPHMFLDAAVTVRADESGVRGVTLDWEFDQWFSSSILLDFDANKDRTFNKAETDDVFASAFTNLARYNYFTFFSLDDSNIPASSVQEFSVRLHENRIIYSFFVPFPVDFNGDSAEFVVAVYDPTFFCDVGYVESDIATLAAPASFDLSYSVIEDENVVISYSNAVIGNGREDASYSGIMHPDFIHIKIEK